MDLVAILYIMNQMSLIDSIVFQFSDGISWPDFGSWWSRLQQNPFFLPKCCITPGLAWKIFSISVKDWRMDLLVWLLMLVLRKIRLQHLRHHHILQMKSWISRKWAIRQFKIWFFFSYFIYWMFNDIEIFAMK